MRIYPGNHKIYNVNEVDKNRDVPLGYLDSEFLEETIILNIDDEFMTDSSEELLPYDPIDSLELTLYNEDGVALTKQEQSLLLSKQAAGNYLYTPKATVVFEPLTFKYRVLAKKNMKYLTSRKYNIKAGCTEETLAKTMIQFFSDSYERKLAPTNIMINNGDRRLESLFNKSLKEIDFLFINAPDGETFDKEKIDINEYLDSNVIPCIICDKLPNMDKPDYEKQKNRSFELLKNEVTNLVGIDTSFYFKMPTDVKHKVSSGELMPIKYHNLFKYQKEFSPIVIKEIVNKGFVIYINTDFIKNLNTFYPLFYEAIMYVYFRSYISTQLIEEWIADEVPDYIVQNGRLTQKDKFTSHMELHKLLGLREGDATPINVEIEEPKIAYYTGMASNYLVFKKVKRANLADPIKDENQISIFTERKNIMFFDHFVYAIKESMDDKIHCSIYDGNLKVTVESFKNTNLDTGSYKTTSLTYELNESAMSQEVLLAWNKNIKTIELVSELRNELVLIATVQVIKEKKDSKLYDMRQRGGGLPEDHEDIYDCLDIGNILGRPYRQGGALIATINIPKKYEHMKDEIYNILYNEIRKHMIADDYLILNLEFN